MYRLQHKISGMTAAVQAHNTICQIYSLYAPRVHGLVRREYLRLALEHMLAIEYEPEFKIGYCLNAATIAFMTKGK